jgi:antitoxin HicB
VTREPAADALEQQPEDAYPIVLARAANGDGPGWIATVEELPGCEARGETPESAAAGMGDAVERWVREARAAGRDVPPPGAAAAHSGKLLVRMPRSLHAELFRAAEREGTSLNAYIVAALSSSVAWRRPGRNGADATASGNGLSLALKANLVVLAVAAAVAIALLITAWAG